VRTASKDVERIARELKEARTDDDVRYG
jgi:hypothetical protein